MHEATGILIETTDGLIALQHRDNKPEIINPDKISSFGGRIEEGESPVNGAIRELEEELGISVDKTHLIPINTYTMVKKLEGWDGILYAYIVKGVDKDSLKLTEGQAIYYLNPENELNHPKLASFTRKIIEDYLKFNKN